MIKGGAVYILTSRNHKILYQASLLTSLQESTIIKKVNKNSFAARYNVTKLVYFEGFHSIEEAIAREKQIKAGSRQKKLDLIKAINPTWEDLYPKILEEW